VTATAASLFCIAPDCKRLRKVRGCCRVCYDHVRQQIHAGETTWAQAEASGLLLPVNREGQRRWGTGRG
jgi:hypothetical protein